MGRKDEFLLSRWHRCLKVSGTVMMQRDGKGWGNRWGFQAVEGPLKIVIKSQGLFVYVLQKEGWGTVCIYLCGVGHSVHVKSRGQLAGAAPLL